MWELRILGTESLGVRGLSCYVEVDGQGILIDPGIALGFTRWKLHPHPIQAVAGYFVRRKIVGLWSKAKYIVFTHMHGDHVPLYNANPFQLDLYILDHSLRKTIIAPPYNLLSMKEKIRLKKIHELYRENLVTINWKGTQIGPLRIYGPYPHGYSPSSVFIVYVEANKPFLHLSDTGLLVDSIIEVIKELKPKIIISDGPPIYRYIYDNNVVETLLNKAKHNLESMLKYTDIVIVDHHINRCDKGYHWIQSIRKTYGNVMTAAEYMGNKPLLLESWRRTLYTLLPIDNCWFKNHYMEGIIKFKPIYYKLIRRIKTVTGLINEEVLSNILSRIITNK